MQFKVMSYKDCVNYSEYQHDESSIVISIRDSCEIKRPYFIKRGNGIKGQLSLFFDDIQPYKGMQYWKKDEGLIIENYTNSDGFAYESRIFQLMTKEDAKKIIQFVERWYNDVDLIIVHCNAGISRSSGVCAGIMKCFTGDDSQIYDNPYYHPNTLCYNLILEEYYKKGDNNDYRNRDNND